MLVVRNAVSGKSAESPTGVHLVLVTAAANPEIMLFFWWAAYSPKNASAQNGDRKYNDIYKGLNSLYSKQNNIQDLVFSFIWLDTCNLTLPRSSTLDPTQAKGRPLAFPACQWIPQTLIQNQDKIKFHVLAIRDLVKCMLLRLGCLLTNQYSAVLASLLVVYTDRLSLP